MGNRTPLLEIKHISKIFPGVKALDDISFSVMPGEVHALAGENGAGKSTLMKIIMGQYQATSGEIWFDGRPANFKTCGGAACRDLNDLSGDQCAYEFNGSPEYIFGP